VGLLAAVLAAVPFAVWRHGHGTMPWLALALCSLLALLSVAAAVVAWNLRRRLPRLELRARAPGRRLAASVPELLLAAGYALAWPLAGLVPREALAAAELAMPLEALVLLAACLAVPVLQARVRRIGDAFGVCLILLLGVALAAALAERAGPVAWIALAALVAWRGWLLERQRRPELQAEQERWLLALWALLGSYWLATLAREFVPLPPLGWLTPVRGAAALPEPWVLLWGLVHFGALALVRWRDWPESRAEHEPPPPPRAFARESRR
jgi:hypothetical protein